jgi:hypothetical protein
MYMQLLVFKAQTIIPSFNVFRKVLLSFKKNLYLKQIRRFAIMIVTVLIRVTLNTN